MSLYLDDIRVLDFSRYIAGPYCGLLLKELGAEVIKVEKRNGGDDTRSLAPQENGVSLYYPGYNRGKKSITVDFRNPKGIDLLKKLIEKADVIVENFRSGTMEKMGLDYETVRKINPRIIMVSVSGFGQTGPYRDRPAFDQIICAMSGLMRKDSTGTPIRPNGPMIDHMGAMNATIAVLCALREREKTGLGQYLDVSMFTSAVIVKNLELGGAAFVEEEEDDNLIDSAPFGVIRVRDGWVNVHAGPDAMYQRLRSISKDPVIHDPKYDDITVRIQDANLLLARIEEEFKAYSCSEVDEIFRKAGVTVGIVMDTKRLLADTHLRETGQFVKTQVPGVGDVDYMGLPFKSSAHTFCTEDWSATLGQHNKEIYSALLGLSDEEIAELENGKII